MSGFDLYRQEAGRSPRSSTTTRSPRTTYAGWSTRPGASCSAGPRPASGAAAVPGSNTSTYGRPRTPPTSTEDSDGAISDPLAATVDAYRVGRGEELSSSRILDPGS